MAQPIFRQASLSDYFVEVARGNVSGVSTIHKFGRNSAVGTSFTPISVGGIYRTPQVAAATALRVKAGNANDTAAGTGAREITVQGLDETGALVTEALATAGGSASANTSATFIRLFRAWVSASGTYATSAAGSHAAAIVIEKAAGSEDWLTIDFTNFPKSQSEIGIYSVPLGSQAFISTIHISVDSSKSVDLLFFQRQGILDAAAPYEAMRMVMRFSGVSGEERFQPYSPLGPYPACTDIGFMAKGASTPAVDVDFEILLFPT